MEVPPTSGANLHADAEKAVPKKSIEDVHVSSDSASSHDALAIHVPETVSRWHRAIESIRGLEARGITRVPPSERHAPSLQSYAQIVLLWYSANITANNLAVGFLGPLLFALGFLDSALIVVFACILGSLGPAYTSIFGPQSGNRTLVVARYFMGYWPSKLIAVLNIILMIGYAIISCIIGGQILSAVSGGSMSVIVGIVIIALITWSIAVFGMIPFQAYERWAWIPQTIVLFILIGSAGPHFDSSLQSTGNSATIAANRLSFFCLQFSVPVSWTAAGADFFVYYPERISKWKVFLMTFTGLSISFILVNLIGVGLASGVANNPSWEDAYGVSGGALILAGYEGLGGFGKFCAVVIALGLCNNNVPGTYAASLDFQTLGKVWKAVPRYFWVTVAAVIFFVCAVAGRDHLFLVMQNFLALMGYWVVIFLTIVLEEHLVFRRGRGFDWSAWEDKSELPAGVAALLAFLIGWVGPIVGMYQVWWTGPAARHLGDTGGDLGFVLGVGFTAVVFPPLRWVEMKFVGR